MTAIYKTTFPWPANSLSVCMLAVLFCVLPADAVAAGKPHPFELRPQPWERRDHPVLSARTTKQSWCSVVCYSPHVIHHDGLFRMWYLGTSVASRSNDIVLGYAESKDGLTWTEYEKNPILTGRDVPWGQIIQTPFVLFDADDKQYKMWFVSGAGIGRDASGKVVSNDQQLGYATSRDGLAWQVRPEPIYRSGRSPSVIKDGPRRYRMWMGSSPSPESAWNDIYKNIYEFKSTDGIQWQRSERPVMTPTIPAQSTVYPFVLKHGPEYLMWHGCHVPGGRFELFCARSADGHRWQVDHRKPAFAATRGKRDFDGRYTSTPCVVEMPDRYLMYYSARDWQNEYIDGTGKKRKDGSGVYSHIGVAVIRKPNAPPASGASE